MIDLEAVMQLLGVAVNDRQMEIGSSGGEEISEKDAAEEGVVVD